MDCHDSALLEPAPITAEVSKAGPVRGMGDQERRRQLIEAAEEVFIVKGYVATTMADIAAAATMSKKTIYQIFASKRELFDSLMIDRVVRLPRPEADSMEPPTAALRSMLLAYGRALLSPRQIILMRLILANIASVPDASEVVRRRCQDAQADLAHWLTGQAAEGAWHIADPRGAADMLLTLAFGSFQSALLLALRETPSETELTARIDWSINLFLREMTI
jgi:AcrR family transcriptional regulator